MLFLFASFLVIAQERLDMGLPCKELEKVAEMNGYGFIRVRKGKPLEAQMRQSKTVYVISSIFDMGGRSFQFPDSSYIKFEEEGSIRNVMIKGKLLNDCLSPNQFGAIGDGKSDDTQALQNVLNLNTSTISLKGKKYLINGFLTIPSNISILGENASIIFSDKEKVYPGINIQSASRISIDGITFCAYKAKNSASPFSRKKGLLSSNRYAITASSVRDLKIRNCSFADVEVAIKIDGGVGNNSNIDILNCSTESSVNTPVYISHTDSDIINGCTLRASADASKYDHHIYGCSSNNHHVISDCRFFDGVGIPIHYYTTETDGVDDIHVEHCSFENTCGAVIVSSGGEGRLEVTDVTMNSSRKYDNGIFRSGGKQSLIVDSATINAPNQRLLSCEGINSVIKRTHAMVGGLVYGLPLAKGNLSIEGCEIKILSTPYLLYLSEKVAPITGNVVLKDNNISFDNTFEYLISVRGTTAGTIKFVNNEIWCNQKVQYVVYNAGKTSKKLYVNNNYIKGVKELRHKSVRGSIIEKNIIE